MPWQRRLAKRRTATSRGRGNVEPSGMQDDSGATCTIRVVGNNESTGKIRGAAALTAWRLLTSVDVVSAQDQQNILKNITRGLLANLNANAACCRMSDTFGCPWWMALSVLCLEKLWVLPCRSSACTRRCRYLVEHP